MTEIDEAMAETVGGVPERRRRTKAPGAFRTISEVATDLEVPQHVLRFWESKFSQVKPLKRGGGRRYYRPEDVDLLRGIRHLLYSDGYTIKGVQKLLREIGSKSIMESGRSPSAPGALSAAGVAAARTRRQSGAPAAPTAERAVDSPLEPGPAEDGTVAGKGGGDGLSAAHRRKLLHLAAELGELRDILRPPGTKN
jgi:DNA-binding transcriptional MerR regulator